MPVNTTRTLVLAIGGTGKAVVRELVRMMNDELNEREYPFLEFFVIDSDTDWSGLTTHSGRAKTHIVGLTLPDDPPMRIRRDRKFHEAGLWMPPYYNNRALWSAAVAGQRRPSGPVFLINSWEEINARMGVTGFFSHQPDMVDGVRPSAGHELLVVTSLCGGTGGGTCLELTRLFHTRLIQKDYQHRIRLFTLDPSFFGPEKVPAQTNTHANWYSSLLEINYLLHSDVYTAARDRVYRLGPTVEGGGQVHRYSADEAARAIEEIFLFESGAGMAGGAAGISLQAMAGAIARFLLVEASDQTFTHHVWHNLAGNSAPFLIGKTRRVAIDPKVPKDQPHFYSSFGMAMLWYPLKRLERELAREGQRRLARLLLEDPPGDLLTTESKRRVLGEAVNSSGISVGQLGIADVGDIVAKVAEECKKQHLTFPEGLRETAQNARMPELMCRSEEAAWKELQSRYLNPLCNDIDSAEDKNEVIGSIDNARKGIHESIERLVKDHAPKDEDLMRIIWRYLYSVQEGGLLSEDCLMSCGNLQDVQEYLGYFYESPAGVPKGRVAEIRQHLSRFRDLWNELERGLAKYTTDTLHPVRTLIEGRWSWARIVMGKKGVREDCKAFVTGWYRLRLRYALATRLIGTMNNLVESLNAARTFVQALAETLKRTRDLRGTQDFTVRDHPLEHEMPFEDDFNSLKDLPQFDQLVRGWTRKVLTEDHKPVDLSLPYFEACVVARDEKTQAIQVRVCPRLTADSWGQRLAYLNAPDSQDAVHKRLWERYCGLADAHGRMIRQVIVDLETRVYLDERAQQKIKQWRHLKPCFGVSEVDMGNLGMSDHFFLFLGLPMNTSSAPCTTDHRCPLINDPHQTCQHYSERERWCLKRFLVENCPGAAIQQPTGGADVDEMQLAFISAVYGFPLFAAESLKPRPVGVLGGKTLQQNYEDYVSGTRGYPPHRFFPDARPGPGNPDRFPDLHEDFFLVPKAGFDAESVEKRREPLEKGARAGEPDSVEKLAALPLELLSGSDND